MKLTRFPAIASVAYLAACGGGSSGGGDGSGGGGGPPPTGGALDQRPANLTCLAPERTSGGGGAGYDVVRVFAGVSLQAPVAMLQAPGDASRWYVLEREGRIISFANDPNVSSSSVFADLRGRVDIQGEGGLLGMAFHPNFPSDNRVFVSWTAPGSPLVSIVASFAVSGGQIDPDSERVILRLNQDDNNHNGGHIAFGPDGLLYAGFGDGGEPSDNFGRAQDTTNLLGSLLRVNVDSGSPYSIPSGNPFAGNAVCPADHSSSRNCPEIFAWGLRNPWRFNFDRDSGELWAADVGEDAREEVDRIRLGGNYGWNCREGKIAGPGRCSGNFIEPIHDYDRSVGVSITGGYVYRGSALPGLRGQYVFGDFGTGRIWRLTPSGGGATVRDLESTNLAIVSFAEDASGELYVVDIGGGLYQIVGDGNSGDGGGANAAPVATLLSETGCVDPAAPSQPASGLIEYEVAAPFWSDGAVKDRWLALPDGTAISLDADGDFNFPNGSVLMKHFRLGGTLIETRLFMRHPDGVWAGYTYEWNGAQTDARLVRDGKSVTVGGQSWIIPSEDECLVCHTSVAGRSLGLETAQLNHSIPYAGTNRTANQLITLSAISVFTNPIGDPNTQPRLPLLDSSAPLSERARAYLHTNCANCHQPNGPTPTGLDLRFSTDLGNMNACNVTPSEGDLGRGSDARIIAPGNPDASVLLARMNRRGADQMPPLASNLVDEQGVALIRDWISSLSGCQ